MTGSRRAACRGLLFWCFWSKLAAALETTAAILLRRIKLTESSLIVTWFTEAHGKLKTVAKGARRPRSPFAGRLDLFFAAEIRANCTACERWR